MNQYVKAYIPLVDFLADCLGEDTEVVLHDLSDYHQSVVAIRNGHISGRGMGSPLTDLSLKVLKTATFEQTPYLANYQSISKEGHMLKASTFFIRDDDGRFVGMLCINADNHKLVTAKDMLNSLVSMLKIPNENAAVTENLNMSVRELVLGNIARIVPDIEHVADTMQQKDKIDLVDKLGDMGTFMIKGAIGYVAEALHVSIPTVYRYLNLVKKAE